MRLFPFGAQTVGGPAEGITTSNAAKFNLRYLIASALQSGGVITIKDTDETTIPTRLADPEFHALMGKVSVEPDLNITLGIALQRRCEHGARRRRASDHVRAARTG